MQPMRLLYAVLITLVAGCAQVVEVREPRITDPSEGALLLRVLPNMAVAPLMTNSHQIVVERIVKPPAAEKLYYRVNGKLDATSRTAIFAASLPPGDYQIAQVSAFRCTVVCMSTWVEPGAQFSHFTIQSGRLTDLGAMVQMLLTSDSVILSHDQHPDPSLTTNILQTSLPDLAPLLDKPTLSWNDAPLIQESIGKGFELSKRYSYGLESVSATGDDRFIYGSANGVVYSWTPGQKPVPHDIGNRVSIESTLVTPNGSWLAGGELGVLKQSDDGGQTWRSMRGNLPFAVVMSLTSWNDQVIATILRHQEISLYMAAQGSDMWKLLARHKMNISLLTDLPAMPIESHLFEDTLFTTIPGRQLAVMDLDSGNAQVRDLPGAVQSFGVSPNGLIRCRCVPFALFAYESSDRGKTWQDASNSRSMNLPVFRDTQHGIAFEGGPFGPNRMHYTEDGGKTWSETTQMPTIFTQLFYSQDGKTAYAGSPDGIFWRSTDDGRHWQPDKRP